MRNISSLTNRDHYLQLNDNCLYFQRQGDLLKSIPFSQFIQLPQSERKDVLEALEKAIGDGIPNLETRHKIQEIRNAIFHSVNQPAPQELIDRIPRDLWSFILSQTSPQTVELCRTVNKGFNKAATRKVQILSVNQGLNLTQILPKTIESWDECLNWLKKSDHAHLLTCADLTDWDVTGEDLKGLFEICPNLLYLSVNSAIQSLPELPRNLQILECCDCAFDKLPELPSTLKVLICVNCRLTALPKLHLGLEVVNCSECPIVELPDLPESLKELNCSETNVVKLPILPRRLQALKIDGCPITRVHVFPPNLEVFECDFSSLETPPLPPSVTRLNGQPFGTHELSDETAQFAAGLMAELKERLKRDREDSESTGDESSRTVRPKNETHDE